MSELDVLLLGGLVGSLYANVGYIRKHLGMDYGTTCIVVSVPLLGAGVLGLMKLLGVVA